jgi:nitroimidazol reductase NimA-like FMN-containing flavoprotein (pyridoxamine 5'-phosphate oxidase superfamily)
MSPESGTRPPETPQFTELASKLLELSRVECLNLLRRTHFGRLGVSRGEGAPMIRPLNYVFDPRSQSVVFRTAQGSKLHGMLRAKEAAFEIDGIEPGGRTGWSVVVIGVADEVTNPSEIRRLEQLGLEVWAPGPRSHWVRIRARTVSGRRIVAVANSSARSAPPT